MQRPESDGAFFQIRLLHDGDALSTDGTPEQAAEVAVWAANSFPPVDEGEIWLTDQGYSGHAVLWPGMTVADVRRGWIEHE